MFHSKRSGLIARWGLLTSISVLGIAQSFDARAADDADEEIDAIWRVQSLPFLFRGHRVFYNCAAFQKKLQAILLSVGAHPSLIIQASCKPDSVTDRIEVRIALATPVEATQANIAAATKFDSKRELLARVQGTALPTASAIEKFRASYRTVNLDNAADLRLEPSDCELVIALRDRLFPKINVTVERSVLVCTAAELPPVVEARALFHQFSDTANTEPLKR
jgi:hypothetical protein